MCVQCMIAATGSATAASGARAWLATRHFSWLTPPRLKRITIALIAAALLASALFASGASKGTTASTPPVAAQRH